MTTVALIRMSRCAAPIGPWGSSTPLCQIDSTAPPLASGNTLTELAGLSSAAAALVLAAGGEAAAQHRLQGDRAIVLLQQVGDRLVDQVLETPAGLAGERLQHVVTCGRHMDHLAHGSTGSLRYRQ